MPGLYAALRLLFHDGWLPTAIAIFASFSPLIAIALASEVLIRVSRSRLRLYQWFRLLRRGNADFLIFWVMAIFTSRSRWGFAICVSFSRSARAFPVSPIFSCSRHAHFRFVDGFCRGFFSQRFDIARSSFISVRLRWSASVLFFSIRCPRFSKYYPGIYPAELISSIVMVAITRRNCPKRISFASSWIVPTLGQQTFGGGMHDSGFGGDGNGEPQGTSTRMFWRLSALVRLASIDKVSDPGRRNPE